MASMLPPGAGRNTVTLRYLRHFNLLYAEPFEEGSLKTIFSNILQWYIDLQNNGSPPLPSSIKPIKDKVVDSTIELYKKIQDSPALLPTPQKSHYIYNLRDISKVFQGICQAKARAFKDDNDFIKLWAHECMRVF